MNQTVQAFLQEKDREIEALREAEKKDFLERTGLARKIYQDEDPEPRLPSGEKQKYPCGEYVDNIYKRYRYEYPAFTEEEFAALREAQERVDAARPVEAMKDHPESRGYTCGLSVVLMILAAALYLGSFIAGIAWGKNDRSDFELSAALLYWGAGLLAGSLTLAAAHIVEHLTRQTELLKALLRKK